MPDDDWLAQRFEEHRSHLRGVAYRMLGSGSDAEDAVQEAWIRLGRSDADDIANLGGWLTTVVSRVSLDLLRSRAARREEPTSTATSREVVDVTANPERDAALADSVGAALLVVLDALSPSERLAFVLHDTFAVPFDEIGPILGRSTNAAKQLASRARQKVRGSDPERDTDPARQRQVVDAFLAASRKGDFEALLTLLDPEIVLDADAASVQMGSPAQTRGADAVARTFSGRAKAAQAALIDGGVGMVWVVAGQTKVAWEFTLVGNKVAHIEMLADPESLSALEVSVFS